MAVMVMISLLLLKFLSLNYHHMVHLISNPKQLMHVTCILGQHCVLFVYYIVTCGAVISSQHKHLPVVHWGQCSNYFTLHYL